MKMSTKGQYALEIVADLALHSGRDHLESLKNIAERRKLSEKYLERIVKPMKRKGNRKECSWRLRRILPGKRCRRTDRAGGTDGSRGGTGSGALPYQREQLRHSLRIVPNQKYLGRNVEDDE